MDNRTRIINTIVNREIDRPPFVMGFGPWPETIEAWKEQGVQDVENWAERFGFDPGFDIVNVNYGVFPEYDFIIIEDKGDTLICRDQIGVLKEIKKHGSSIPRHIEYPVKNKEDWEILRNERLDPDNPGRFPKNWSVLAENYNKSDKVIQVGAYPFGLFGTLRDLMGIEELCVSFYEQPDLIHEMMDYLTNFWLKIYEKICRDVKVDAIHIWEDMSGKTGSLISPKLVEEFMLPNYKKIKEFADMNDIPIISLDTDGDCTELVPLFIEAGINLIFPFEVAAGSDILDYRKRYPRLGIMGGIDKREIANGKAAIDGELRRISPMFEENGYLAILDHTIHPEISFDDYSYYIERLKQIIGI